MRIDKTEREFWEIMGRAFEAYRRSEDPSWSVTLCQIAADLDLEFKPEEPEPAKRIYPKEDVRGLWAYDSLMAAHRRLTKEEEEEAAARYNTVGRLIGMEEFRADDLPGDTLHNVLAEEREKLKEGR